MARYKDVEGYRKLFDEEYKETRKLISEGETHLDNLAEGFSEASRVIDRIPAADVVPKSEYDAVVSAVDNSTKEFLKLHDVYQNAKAEVERLEKEIKALLAFKDYFSDLYGHGLEVANWHENGALEPFDNFYDSAEEEYERSLI